MSTVHVGIVTYNSLSDLPTCLEHIRAQTYLRVTLTILDNASHDGTPDWVQEQSFEVNLIRNTDNVGFGRAHNQIIRSLTFAADDFYLCLNPDALLDTAYIENLVRGLKTYDAQWGIGKLLLPDGKHIYSTGHALLRNGYAFNIGYGMLDDGQPSREVFGAAGAAALYSAEMLQGVLRYDNDIFDDSMFMYSEDVDLDWRAQRLGYRCWYIADAIAIHRGSQASAHFRDMALVNRFVMVIKNASLPTLVFYNMLQISIHLLLRTVLNPRRGFKLIQQTIIKGYGALRKRSNIKNYNIGDWHSWSQQQPTQLPITYQQRLVSFWRRKIASE